MTTILSSRYDNQALVPVPVTHGWVDIPVFAPVSIGPLEYGGSIQVSLFLGTIVNTGAIGFNIDIRVVDRGDGDAVVGVVQLFEPSRQVVSLTVPYTAAPRSRPELVAQWHRYPGDDHSPSVVFQGSTMSLVAVVVPEEA